VLKTVPDPEVVDALIQALNDPDDEVSATAAKALGTVGD
jgi:HEAT repeat protein